MYLHKSQYDDGQKYNDMHARLLDDYDRSKEKQTSRSEILQDFYSKYGEEAYSGTERREYNDSPKRLYTEDPLKRDWSRNSPGRRRMSSPGYSVPEKKRGRYPEDDDDYYKYRNEPDDKMYMKDSRPRHDGPDSKYRKDYDRHDSRYRDQDDGHDLKDRKDYDRQDLRHRERRGVYDRQEPRYREKYDGQESKYREQYGGHNLKDRKDYDRQDLRHRERRGSYDRQEPSRRDQDGDFSYRPSPEGFTHRRQSGYPKDAPDRNRGHSQERTHSYEFPTKVYPMLREKSDRIFTDSVEPRHTETKFPINGSSGQSLGYVHQSPIQEEIKSNEGFQRFLSVLNKGVNVAMLNKMMTQDSARVDAPSPSPTYFSNAKHSWSPPYSERQQQKYQTTHKWSKPDESQGHASPQYRSLSPKDYSLPDTKPRKRHDEPVSTTFSAYSQSRSPTVVERMRLKPEDEHKHRQVQDVLHAIGMDLGFEELGQMTHRIQERLYGKDNDRGHHRSSREKNTLQSFSPRRQTRSSSSPGRLEEAGQLSPRIPRWLHWKDSRGQSREKDMKQAFSPKSRSRSRSSSSRSSYGPGARTYTQRKDQEIKYGRFAAESSSKSAQDTEKSESHHQRRTGALSSFPTNPTSTQSQLPLPPPAVPPFPLMPFPPIGFLPPPPTVPPPWPRPFAHPPPPFLSYPSAPHLNAFPALCAQQSVFGAHPPPYFNTPPPYPIQQLQNTQKTKPQARPRCLQVITPKQPG
ncbi:cyclin-dependent kinase 12-like isoform X2 [Thalassophryne amazonica]|uniref:cyclin-dependent kinase 12-like isoform X2 n=1 Tax=Thalassophryne amazonica TaxID=390379 RepID=UPI0014724FB6|nr:cyclin-dependent kinase 12-like isoform X2 [Thalassophryne amazonica]